MQAQAAIGTVDINEALLKNIINKTMVKRSGRTGMK
jgi:hypothetical protein